MAEPLVITIPHKLGKEESLRRLAERIIPIMTRTPCSIQVELARSRRSPPRRRVNVQLGVHSAEVAIRAVPTWELGSLCVLWPVRVLLPCHRSETARGARRQQPQSLGYP